MFNPDADEYLGKILQQDNKCAICNIDIEFIGNSKDYNSAVIDHCHNTGKVRGILCNHCNIALGLLKDNTETLLNAIVYLKTNQ